jgi:general secretion pathway protein M
MLAAAAAVIGVAMLYLVAIEPAWLMRAHALRAMPDLQEQLSQVQALREEVRLLRQQGTGTQGVASLRTAAQQSLERAGVAAAIQAEGSHTLMLKASSVPAATWFAWIEQFSREARVRIAFARIARAGAGGMVEAEVGFEVPAN